MTLKYKLKRDIKFFDPETMESKCTFNGCHDKFEEKTRFTIKTPAWNKYSPVKFLTHYHQCTEPGCKIKHSNRLDKANSFRSYEGDGVYGRKYTLTLEENKAALEKIKKLYAMTRDPKKIEDMETTMIELETKIGEDK